jgi:cation transport protein ChaC
LRYLYDRELVTGVYTAAWHAVGLHEAGAGREVRALAFVADRTHPQYAGVVPLARQAAVVRAARGPAGRNLDYVVSTARHLADLGIRDRYVERLVSLVGPQHLRQGSPCTTALPPNGYRSPASASRPLSAEMRLAPLLPPSKSLLVSHRRRLGRA